MDHPLLASPHRITDADLLGRMGQFAACDRDTTAELVAHLAEVEARELHLAAGYASLFDYCRRGLGFSEHEAYTRCAAARAVRRFPSILNLLIEGSINLTTIRLLGSHLTPENHRRVLDFARYRRKAEIEEIVAALAPRADVPMSIVTSPLAPDRYRLQVTISGETLEKLRLAADMLGHAVPTCDGAAIVDRALTALLGDLARKKFGATEHPRRSQAPSDGASRHIPAEVKRAVWVRDLGRCAFVGSGRRCDERRRLEFHHVTPYAVGGPPTVDNIQLRCQRHNQYESKTYFAAIDCYRSDEVRERRSGYRVGAANAPLALQSYPFQNGVC